MRGVIFPGLRAARSYVPATAVFSPLSLSPALWLKADAGTLQTVAGSAASADADPVGQWLDQSGNSRHVSQATSTKRGTLKLNLLNGLPAVRFDGVDDLIKAIFTLPQPNHWFILGRYRAGGVGNPTIADGGSDNAARSFSASGLHSIYAGGVIIGGPAVVTDEWVTIQSLFNGASSHVSKNGGTKTVGDAGATAAGGVTLGNRSGGSEAGSADIVEAIVYPSQLSAGNEANVLTYLRTRGAHY